MWGEIKKLPTRVLPCLLHSRLRNLASPSVMSTGAIEEQRIVIVGGGIIGICSAFYLLGSGLLSPNLTVTMIENVGIASAASVKAGGFISRDWHNSETESLARESWLEHVALAERYDGVQKWGWRECGAIGLRVGSQEEDVERSAYRLLPEGEGMRGESWLNGEREDMSGSGGIAQLSVRSQSRVRRN